MFTYRASHYLNEQAQKNTFEKYNRNNFGAAKNFIAEISIVPSQLTLISSLIVQENEIRTLCNNIKLI